MQPKGSAAQATKTRESQREGGRAEKSKRADKSKRPPPTPPKPQPEVLAEAMRELERLIGLATVKKELSDLAHFLKIQLERGPWDCRRRISRCTCCSTETPARARPPWCAS